MTIRCVPKALLGLCLLGAAAWAKELPPVHTTELLGGVVLTAGNSETLAINAGAATTHLSGKNEFKAKAEVKYGESTVEDDAGRRIDEATTDNGRAEAQYNRLLWENTYEYVQTSGFYDEIAAVDYRIIAGPGIGQYLIKHEVTRLNIEAGIAYLAERVDEVEQDDALLRLAQRLEHTLQEGATVWQSVEYLPTFGDVGAFLLNSEVGTESILTSAIRLRVTLQDRYDSEPALESESNDLTLTAAVVYRM